MTLKFQQICRWRLQQVRDGAALFARNYFSKYVSLSSETPAFVGNLRELQQERLLDAIKFALSKMDDTWDAVNRLASFLSMIENMQEEHQDAGTALAQKISELSGGVLGMQAACKMALDDQSKQARLLHRTAEIFAGN